MRSPREKIQVRRQGALNQDPPGTIALEALTGGGPSREGLVLLIHPLAQVCIPGIILYAYFSLFPRVHFRKSCWLFLQRSSICFNVRQPGPRNSHLLPEHSSVPFGVSALHSDRRPPSPFIIWSLQLPE